MGAARYAALLSPVRSYLLTRLQRSSGRTDIIPSTRPHALFAHTQHYLPVHKTNWVHFPFVNRQLCKGRSTATMLSSRISQQWTSLPTLPSHTPLLQLQFFISALAHTPCCDVIRGGRLPDCMAPWRHLEIGKILSLSVCSIYRKPLFTEGHFRW
jgi:hypothetical protein